MIADSDFLPNHMKHLLQASFWSSKAQFKIIYQRDKIDSHSSC